MSGLIAKKYTNAIISVCDKKELEQVLNSYNTVASLFGDDKFIEIVKSPLVDSKDKVEIIVIAAGKCSDKFTNSIKLLAEKNRIMEIPAIRDEINEYVARSLSKYDGIITSKDSLNSKKVLSLETQLSKHFGITLKLKQEKSNYDGVKVEVQGLGVKVDFSQSRLKTQMINHILKAL